MKTITYCFMIAASFFMNVNACPTCIGNLHDEATPPFFSNELYQAPQVSQNDKKQLADLFDENNEPEKIDEVRENS